MGVNSLRFFRRPRCVSSSSDCTPPGKSTKGSGGNASVAAPAVPIGKTGILEYETTPESGAERGAGERLTSVERMVE